MTRNIEKDEQKDLNNHLDNIHISKNSLIVSVTWVKRNSIHSISNKSLQKNYLISIVMFFFESNVIKSLRVNIFIIDDSIC